MSVLIKECVCGVYPRYRLLRRINILSLAFSIPDSMLGTNGLEEASKPPTMAGQMGSFQKQDSSAVTHPRSSHIRCVFCNIAIPTSLRHWLHNVNQRNLENTYYMRESDELPPGDSYSDLAQT
ncbi:hypothetical protein J6590_035179 [Homalodisca vitripennis]|nr:hypothetical protein J6590_035179 [Homalodisca vitripennis]